MKLRPAALSGSGEVRTAVAGTLGLDAPAVTMGASGSVAGQGGGGALPLAAIDLAVDGAVYELDLSAGDYSPNVTAGNGGSIVYGATSGWNGEPGVTLNPPTALVGANADYCEVLNGAFTAGIRSGITTFNWGALMFFAPNYGSATRGFDTKFVGPNNFAPRWLSNVQVADNAPAGMAPIAVAVTTIKNFQTGTWPGAYTGNWWYDARPGLAIAYIGASPDHAGTATRGTPVVGNEWVWIEYHYDYANGPIGYGDHRIFIYTSDGVVAGLRGRIDASIDAANQWPGPGEFQGFDGIGHFWNGAADDVPDNHMIYSHFRFSPNRAADNPIGPPAGFVTG